MNGNLGRCRRRHRARLANWKANVGEEEEGEGEEEEL